MTNSKHPEITFGKTFSEMEKLTIIEEPANSRRERKRWLTCMALLTFCCIASVASQGQNLAIGNWQHHLPNNRIIAIAETPTKLIGATPYALIVYNKDDQSVEKVDKVKGLSDFGISSIAFAKEQEMLIVGYENGNVDIIKNNQVFNIPDIKMASVMGSKKINSILIIADKAYLACDFGIIELDLPRLLINDTFYIGPQGSLVNVNDLVFDGTHFYAATNQGIRVANAQAPNLADFNNWQREVVTGLPNETFTLAIIFGGKIFATLSNQQGEFLYYQDGSGWQLFDLWNDGYRQGKYKLRTSGGFLLVCNHDWLDLFNEDLTFYRRYDVSPNGRFRPMDAWIDQENSLWIGDRFDGLMREQSENNWEQILLPGPTTANVFSIATGGGKVWLAPGSISRGGSNTWNSEGVFIYDQKNWSNYNRLTDADMDNMWDLIRITPDPSNPNKAYASTWTSGILEITTTGVEKRYDHTNSTLRRRFEIDDWTRVGGVAVDRRGNVWVTNSQVQRPLSVKKTDGQWLSFSGAGHVATSQVVGDIVIDNSNQKWIILHQGSGIFLFQENNLDSDNDFQARRLTTQHGLPSNEIYSIAVDHNGYVWVGTDQGVGVFYSPNRAFSGEPFSAQLIIVEQDGFGGYLFENETINAIEVDGSNKKWFGTTRSGAFLLSADARETIFHFNTQNSPLPSNNILDIAIMKETGEVFFATDKGLVSFRGMATAGQTTHTDVYAYPNPVRPGYNGYIAVKGLITNARVKITDINGNLVYETIAEGGQAVWKGQDLFGNRPSTGVYLVFSTNDDGSETMVTKILFVN